MKHQDVRDQLLVDVRTRAEYVEEHIPGSVHIPLHKVKRFADLLGDVEVVTVCRTGVRASKAAAKLPNAKPLEGGILEYKQTGGKIEGVSAPWSVQRQVRLVAGLLVVVGSVLAYVGSPAWLLLSGFVGAGLAFAGATDTCGMAKVLARVSFNSRSDEAIKKELEGNIQ